MFTTAKKLHIYVIVGGGFDMNKTRILAIDGGGMKGIVSALVLERLEQLLQVYSKNEDARISEYFDIIGGTSTGAIMAALYLCPDHNGKPKFSASDVVELYMEHGKEIFRKKKLYPVNTLFGLLSPKYSNKTFEKLLDQYFGELKMKDLLKPCLLASYNTENCEAAFFTTETQGHCTYTEYPVKKAVLASTAAPTYFPPVTIGCGHRQNNCYIDGGVVANNPSLCTLIEAIKLGKSTEITDMHLLSIGNVSRTERYTYQQVDGWGMAGWAIPIFQIIMGASEQTVDYEIRRLFEILHMSKQYTRIELEVKERTPPMDDASKETIKKLIKYGEELIKESEKSLKNVAKELIESKSQEDSIHREW